MAAGKMNHRMMFQSRRAVDDDLGNTRGDWITVFECAVGMKPLRGGETVIASRLTGVQPAVLTVRYSSDSLKVTPGWRAVDNRSGASYNIRSVADMEGSRMYLDMLAESGGPDG